jgi:hypothetical protein
MHSEYHLFPVAFASLLNKTVADLEFQGLVQWAVEPDIWLEGPYPSDQLFWMVRTTFHHNPLPQNWGLWPRIYGQFLGVYQVIDNYIEC